MTEKEAEILEARKRQKNNERVTMPTTFHGQVWDVVDKSKDNELDVDKYGERAAYYLKTGAGVGSVGQVDADMIDVFRGANAMVITSNPQQRKTFDYIKDVLSDPRIAPETPIAILANFRDLVTDENRQVSREEYAALVQVDPRHRFVFECSSKNCYGLKELYDFLTVPFLKLQERYVILPHANAHLIRGHL